MKNVTSNSGNKSVTRRERAANRRRQLEHGNDTGDRPTTREPIGGDSSNTGDSGGATTDPTTNDERAELPGFGSDLNTTDSDGVGVKISRSGTSMGRGSNGGDNRNGGDRSNRKSNDRTTEGKTSFDNEESDIWDSPKLSFENLHSSDTPKKRGRKPKNQTTDIPGLADGFKFLYSVPTVFLGDTHEHWYLTDIQAEELSKAFVKAVGSSENKNFAKLLKMLEKYIPVFMLISCVYVITAPRIKQSVKLIDNDTKRNKARILHAVTPITETDSPSGSIENFGRTANNQSAEITQ